MTPPKYPKQLGSKHWQKAGLPAAALKAQNATIASADRAWKAVPFGKIDAVSKLNDYRLRKDPKGNLATGKDGHRKLLVAKIALERLRVRFGETERVIRDNADLVRELRLAAGQADLLIERELDPRLRKLDQAVIDPLEAEKTSKKEMKTATKEAKKTGANQPRELSQVSVRIDGNQVASAPRGVRYPNGQVKLFNVKWNIGITPPGTFAGKKATLQASYVVMGEGTFLNDMTVASVYPGGKTVELRD